MVVDNDHARSEHPRQASTPASHVWTRQLNSQANRIEKRRESFLAVQHGGFVNTKTSHVHLPTAQPLLEEGSFSRLVRLRHDEWRGMGVVSSQLPAHVGHRSPSGACRPDSSGSPRA
jgi:hypothetical protein